MRPSVKYLDPKQHAYRMWPVWVGEHAPQSCLHCGQPEWAHAANASDERQQQEITQ